MVVVVGDGDHDVVVVVDEYGWDGVVDDGVGVVVVDVDGVGVVVVDDGVGVVVAVGVGDVVDDDV